MGPVLAVTSIFTPVDVPKVLILYHRVRVAVNFRSTIRYNHW